MSKHIHELRDPIHNFIHFDSKEKIAIDSRPIQRLRHIHQLALTNLVYPGATHRRFEHSLGVMELAGRVYDIIINHNNIFHDSVREIVPKNELERQYWRRVLHMAALFHDVGHLPFSHAAEKELLPDDWNHERLTVEIIRSSEMEDVWSKLKIQTEDIAKLAVGPKHYKKCEFDKWERILSEVIVGDVLGVDRMDYLLRDSYHTGVAYGKFDHHRLVETIRILPEEHPDDIGSKEPALGIEEGGLHSAESMILARYFMYTQVYFHPVRLIYDIHLREFLKFWLPNRGFPIDVENHLRMTDNEVFEGMFDVARKENHSGYESANRIIKRKHFKLLYKRTPTDSFRNLGISEIIYAEACENFGNENIKRYKPNKHEKPDKNKISDFPVRIHDGRIVSAQTLSDMLTKQHDDIDFIFINPINERDAKKWLEKNLENMINKKAKEM